MKHLSQCLLSENKKQIGQFDCGSFKMNVYFERNSIIKTLATKLNPVFYWI